MGPIPAPATSAWPSCRTLPPPRMRCTGSFRCWAEESRQETRMSVIVRGFDTLNLSDNLRDALRRRLRELIGLSLIVLAMLLAVALASWSAQDPSLSYATNARPHNLLGVPGAIVADLL